MSFPLPTAVLPDGDDADAVRLRADRRRRLLDAMATHDLDALVLSRPPNILYASGARQLWTAGTKPVGPACIVVRATGRIHLVSASAEGVPVEIPHDDLVARSWNPAHLRAAIQAVPGLAGARTVGTDSSSPGLPGRLRAVAPDAALVDGGPALWAARTTKTAGELAHIAAATAVATSGLAAMADALRPGGTERGLLGAFLECIALLGAPTPPTEGVVCVTPTTGPVALRRLATDRPVEKGELVVLDAGAIVAGYEGGVGRTQLAGATPSPAHEELAARCRHALAAVIAACRAGATSADVRQAWDATGEARPPVPVVHGVGLGMEPPLIVSPIEDEAVLVAGSVLSVMSWVAVEGIGGWLERDLIVVGDAPEVLSRPRSAGRAA